MESFLTKDLISSLYAKTTNFAEIARIIKSEYGVSYTRERIRQKAHQYGIAPRCSKCRREISSFGAKYCDECRRVEKQVIYKRHLLDSRKKKTFNDRKVISDAVDFFKGCGLDVIVDTQSKNGSPELLVTGIESSARIKCFKMTHFACGHQSRLQNVENVDYYYLSDCDGCILIVPSREISKRINYVGIRSPLRRYGLVPWLDKVIKSINDGVEINE